MPLTADQIVNEAKRLPREQLFEVIEQLEAVAVGGMDPEIEAAWGEEALRRLAEVESGKVKTIPGEEVMAKARKIAGL